MPIYLAPFIGDGSHENAYQPVGIEEAGGGFLNLRPDSTKPEGRAILYAPTALSDSRLTKIGDALSDRLGPVALNLINSRLGITQSKTGLLDIIVDLLTIHAAGRWGVLQPCEYGPWAWEIFLGKLGRIWGVPRFAGGATYNETWTAADNASVIDATLDWTNVAGVLGILSNQVKTYSAANTVHMGRAESALASANHYAQLSIVTLPASGSSGAQAGPAVRFAAAADTSYQARLRNQVSDSKIYLSLHSRITGSSNNLGTAVNVTASVSLPDTVKAQINGSTLTSYLNGDLVETFTTTEDPQWTNAYCGIMLYNRDGNDVVVDTWEAADLGVSTVVQDLIMAGLIPFAR